MNGGLFKSASRFALVAAAGLLAGGVAAQAADLGGNCCADLEERVAELEATTARKGNRKVKLTVSGQVNEALMFWDDGKETNAYIVSNNMSRTRFRFVGDAKINSDWSAGYLLEIGVRYANSGNRNQNTSNAGGESNSLDIRHSAWWIDSKQLGRIWVGQTSTATDGITEINLANAITGGIDASAWQGGFFLRNNDGSLNSRKWNDVTPSQAGAWGVGEGDRNNVVKYVSPTFAGFTVQAAWGEDDQWDAALRYAGEFSGIRVAAGAGYRQINDNFGKSGADGPRCADNGGGVSSAVDCNSIGLSGSVMHVATGLYVHGAWGQLEDKNRKPLLGAFAKDKETSWYLQAGIEQNFFGIGKTTLFGEYGNYEAGSGLTANGAGYNGFISADTTVWGIGLTQGIDAAAMDLYVGYKHFDTDIVGLPAGATNVKGKQEFDAVVMGGIIRF
ncbi:MAG: hypothetical protein ABL904_18140 [Hyphomicrobiaceae bacterium]